MKEMLAGPVRLGRLQTLFARKDGRVVGVNVGRMYECPFILLTNPPQNNVALTAGASAPAVAMRASAEGPMQIVELGKVYDSTHKVCRVMLTVQDGNGAHPLMNTPCHLLNIFGPGGQMYPLPEALYLDENRALTATFIDISAILVASKARDGANVATITTAEPHGLAAADNVTVALNPADATFDGNAIVVATPTLTTFTYASIGPLLAAAASGGTVSRIPTANQARICAPAAKYSKVQFDPNLKRIKQRLQEQQYLSMPYWYTLDDGFVTLTGLQAVEKEITINPEFNFDVHQIMAHSTGRFNINIIDLTKGESLINAPSNTNFSVPDRLIVGTGSYPYYLTFPWMVYAGQRLLVRLQDTSGYPNAVYLTLGGSAMRVLKWS